MLAGDLAQSHPLFETALAGLEKILGAEHPLTKTVRLHRDMVLNVLNGQR
jgi:hypothetical protein